MRAAPGAEGFGLDGARRGKELRRTERIADLDTRIWWGELCLGPECHHDYARLRIAEDPVGRQPIGHVWRPGIRIDKPLTGNPLGRDQGPGFPDHPVDPLRAA